MLATSLIQKWRNTPGDCQSSVENNKNKKLKALINSQPAFYVLALVIILLLVVVPKR